MSSRSYASINGGRARDVIGDALNVVSAHWLFFVPLGFFALYYTLQNILGFATLPKDLVATFVLVMALTVAVYVLVYRWTPVSWIERVIPFRLSLAAVDAMAGAGMLAYLAVLMTACATADRVPLFAAFFGTSALELTEFRETFLRTRTGWGEVLNYVYVILNNSVMPIVVTYALWRVKWWRYWALVLFVPGLSLTLQKGAIASAALPLLVLFAMQRRIRAFAVTAACSVLLVILMYVLASGRLGPIVETSVLAVREAAQSIEEPRAGSKLEVQVQNASAVPENYNILGRDDQLSLIEEPRVGSKLEVQVQNASAVPENYNILGRDDQLSLIVNRIVWIPYVTAIDWLRYQRDKLHGELVLGRSIKPLAYLLRVPTINLENEVSALQWGQNLTGTGSSNAVFFVDAWVNFGVLGVILYTALFAFTIKLIATSRFVPLTVSAIVPVYTACLVALPPVFLSGGLAIFLVLALLLRGDCRLVQESCR